MRIKLLRELFPNARFIHIYRHPEKVIPSSIHMWNVVGSQNCMKGKWKAPTTEDTAKFLNHMLTNIQSDLQSLPDKDYVELCFETFEKDPLQGLKYIYKQLGLPYTTEFNKKLMAYLKSVKGYQKNTYNNHSMNQERIYTLLSDQYKRYNYTKIQYAANEV